MPTSKSRKARSKLTWSLKQVGVTPYEMKVCPPADKFDTVYVGEVKVVPRPPTNNKREKE